MVAFVCKVIKNQEHSNLKDKTQLPICGDNFFNFIR